MLSIFSVGSVLVIGTWVALYFGFFGLSYYVLPKFGVSYATKPAVFVPFAISYLVIMAVIISLYISDSAALTVSYIEIIVAVFVLFAVGYGLYLLYKILHWYPKNETKGTQELSMRTEYLIGRLANVTFQQLAIYLLLVIVRGLASELFVQALLMGAIFGTIHLALIINFKDLKLIAIIFLGTLSLGFVIPYMYAYFAFPFATLLALHYLAYILIAPVGYIILTALRIPITLTQSNLLN